MICVLSLPCTLGKDRVKCVLSTYYMPGAVHIIISSNFPNTSQVSFIVSSSDERNNSERFGDLLNTTQHHTSRQLTSDPGSV